MNVEKAKAAFTAYRNASGFPPEWDGLPETAQAGWLAVVTFFETGLLPAPNAWLGTLADSMEST